MGHRRRTTGGPPGGYWGYWGLLGGPLEGLGGNRRQKGGTTDHWSLRLTQSAASHAKSRLQNSTDHQPNQQDIIGQGFPKKQGLDDSDGTSFVGLVGIAFQSRFLKVMPMLIPNSTVDEATVGGDETWSLECKFHPSFMTTTLQD